MLILGGVAPLVLAAADVRAAAGIGALHGGQAVSRRSVSARRCARISGDGGGRDLLRDDRDGAADPEASSGIGVVLSRPYIVGSVMLWLAYFMGLVIFYALINWMPILFKDAGIDPSTATLIAALFPLGGVGAVFFGWLMDRFNANRIIAVGYALTAVRRLRHRPGHRQRGPAGAGGVHRGHADEHRAIVDAGAGRRVLSDAGPGDRRRLDARLRAASAASPARSWWPSWRPGNCRCRGFSPWWRFPG